MSSTAGNDLKNAFADARNGDQFRVLKVVIDDGKQKGPWDAATGSSEECCIGQCCDASVLCVVYHSSVGETCLSTVSFDMVRNTQSKVAFLVLYDIVLE